MTISHRTVKPFFPGINPKDVAELQTVHLPNIENISAEDLKRRAIEIPIRFPHLKEETPALTFYELKRREEMAQLHEASQRPHLTISRGPAPVLAMDRFAAAERDTNY